MHGDGQGAEVVGPGRAERGIGHHAAVVLEARAAFELGAQTDAPPIEERRRHRHCEPRGEQPQNFPLQGELPLTEFIVGDPRNVMGEDHDGPEVPFLDVQRVLYYADSPGDGDCERARLVRGHGLSKGAR